MNAYQKRPTLSLFSGVIALLLCGPALAANPATGTTTTGQSLNIQIVTPEDGVTVDETLPVDVTGVVSIGTLSLDINIAYVVDVSGSTEYSSTLNQDCNGDSVVDNDDDLNGDGQVGNTLDCEIAGVLALNNSFTGLVGVDVSFVPFGSYASVADVGPDPGVQASTTPVEQDADGDSVVDLETVATSLDAGEINEFTLMSLDTGTNFANALISINDAFATQPAGESNIAFMLSDGVGSQSAAELEAALTATVAAGTIVNTYSVGAGASGCGSTAQLHQIAVTTGGACVEVLDPAELASVLTGATPAGIDSVEVTLNGGGATIANLDALGNFDTVFPGSMLVPGANPIDATVLATDGTEVTATVTVFTDGGGGDDDDDDDDDDDGCPGDDDDGDDDDDDGDDDDGDDDGDDDDGDDDDDDDDSGCTCGSGWGGWGGHGGHGGCGGHGGHGG